MSAETWTCSTCQQSFEHGSESPVDGVGGQLCTVCAIGIGLL